MTDEAKPAETPGPYRVVTAHEGTWTIEGPGPDVHTRRWISPVRVHAIDRADAMNAAHADGVASANERNDARWKRVEERLAKWNSHVVCAKEALRLIDEERGKP